MCKILHLSLLNVFAISTSADMNNIRNRSVFCVFVYITSATFTCILATACNGYAMGIRLTQVIGSTFIVTTTWMAIPVIGSIDSLYASNWGNTGSCAGKQASFMHECSLQTQAYDTLRKNDSN